MPRAVGLGSGAGSGGGVGCAFGAALARDARGVRGFAAAVPAEPPRALVLADFEPALAGFEPVAAGFDPVVTGFDPVVARGVRGVADRARGARGVVCFFGSDAGFFSAGSTAETGFSWGASSGGVSGRELMGPP